VFLHQINAAKLAIDFGRGMMIFVKDFRAHADAKTIIYVAPAESH
jgi:hypothetical protein